MAQTGLVGLESAIKKLPGVLGCVILTTPDGLPSEIQAFTQAGADADVLRKSIADEVAARGLGPLKQLFVFELDAESHFGDRESVARAAELAEQEARSRGPLSVPAPAPPPPPPLRSPGLAARPPLRRVLLSSSSWKSEAEVALGGAGEEVVGQAEGDKTPHGLRVLAEATLQAAGRLVDRFDFRLVGASLVSSFEREAVLVIVTEEDWPETIGAALVRQGPVSEAAVRATLDAINRRLAQQS